MKETKPTETSTEKSEQLVLPLKPGNSLQRTRGREGAAENTEPPMGTTAGAPTPGTVSTKQRRIAELARKMPDVALRSLSHHIDMNWMHDAHRRTRKGGAKGVDGLSSADFAANLEGNLQSLRDRAMAGTYRAPPVRRVHIPKGDGSKTRPIGIPTFEDKVLQSAVKMLLEPVYEEEFYDFSYGFRPGRSPHDALSALRDGLFRMGGGWVLEVDIQSFFDSLDHRALRDILCRRIVDGVVVRLIGKWLNAGVLEGGVVHRAETGSPQGGVISPLLANIYLHEVLDGWWAKEVLPRLRGKAFLVRYADDFVMVFERQGDAHRVHDALPKRFGRYGLRLHPDKTRLVPFRHPARRPPLGDGIEPDAGSFDFLGFTHVWDKSRNKKWIPRQRTATGRLTRALRTVRAWLRANLHQPLAEQVATLGQKLEGHYRYFGITGNYDALARFYHEVCRAWKLWLDRRSQRARTSWARFGRRAQRWLPRPVLYRSVHRLRANP